MKMKVAAKYQAENEEGFAFVMALLTMLLLTSLGLLIFSLTTKDQIISLRLSTEKKSFSAAENGVTQVLLNFAPGTSSAGADPNDPTTWPQADNNTDPNTRYYYSIPPATDTANVTFCPPPPGSNIETATGICYNVDVRGAHVNFTSQQQLLVGVRIGGIGSSSSN